MELSSKCHDNRSSTEKNWFDAEKKTYSYRERDEKARAKFIEQIKNYARERLVYVDEAGVDNNIDYPYGYCHHSERFHASKLGHRTQRVSMISGWCCGEIVAPMVFEGYCDGEVFCGWMEKFLLEELLPGQIVIIDNASFHSKKKIENLLKQAGCQVIFLPTYSPDLNKIEKFWARLKNHLSKIVDQFENLIDAVSETFIELS